MKKFSWLFILFLICTIVGCSKDKEESNYYIYYLNMDATSVLREEYQPVCKTGNAEELTKELLERLQGEPEMTALRQTIPSDLSYSFSPAGYILNLDFDDKYYDMLWNRLL